MFTNNFVNDKMTLLKIGGRQTTKVWAYEAAKLTRSLKMPDMERLKAGLSEEKLSLTPCLRTLSNVQRHGIRLYFL
jgi:hypothetical protein